MTSIERYRKAASEAQMRETIAEVVALHGGRMFWIRRSDLVPEMADWPDLVVILPPRVIFCELKSARRATTPGQAMVLDLLASCDAVETIVVRPVPRPGECSFDDCLALLRGDPA